MASSRRQRDRALRSLAGLSVGDAFGELFFALPRGWLEERRLPEGPWSWTDDTHMALSLVETLTALGEIEEDALARAFARRFSEEPWRGYGGGARRLLARCAEGADWRREAPRLFDGGSWGNGAAMRVAPLGAWFAGDPERAREQARRSARVTHAHPEGQAGAMAVAVAAAIVAGRESAPAGADLLSEVLAGVPSGRTREGIEEALRIPPGACSDAASRLGTGHQIAAFDTVPFCLWVAARHGREFETAIWTTVSGGGDRDTTCAIVGGIVACRSRVPPEWLARREPLPAGFG